MFTVSHDWLCVSRCHMLSPPSPVCRGIGASKAAQWDSTTTSRKVHASPVTRPALPVQVRAQVKGHELYENWMSWTWMSLKHMSWYTHCCLQYSCVLCMLKIVFVSVGIRCRCWGMQPLCRELLNGGVDVCVLLQCWLLRHRAKLRDSWWAQDM